MTNYDYLSSIQSVTGNQYGVGPKTPHSSADLPKQSKAKQKKFLTKAQTVASMPCKLPKA